MLLPHPPMSPWARGAITWLLCCAAGLVGLCLAPPQTHIIPLYLGSGIGLACVLGWGMGMAWAVGLASASVLLVAHVLQGGRPTDGLQLASLLPTILGGASQAWLGARWGRDPKDQSVRLESPGQIGRFLLIAGPLACLINATVTMSTRVGLGLMPEVDWPSGVLTWWAGDTLGVLLGAPMMLTLVGQPTNWWRTRRWVVGLPLLVSSLILGASIHRVQDWERERSSTTFHHDAVALSNDIQLRLHGYLDALEAMNGLFIASSDVSRQEFHRASAHWLQSLHGIEAVGWSERVLPGQGDAFEAQQQAEGLSLLRLRNGPQGPRPAADQEVLAVRYIEPKDSNQAALGTNFLALASARDAYERSLREDRSVAADNFTGQAGEHPHIVVLYRAVYDSDTHTPEGRQQAARGALFLTLRMDEALAAITGPTDARSEHLRTCLVDVSGPAPVRLGGAPGCDATESDWVHRRTTPVEFAGRRWQIVVDSLEPAPFAGHWRWTWLLSVGGVLLAAALGGLLLVMTGQKRRIEMAMAKAQEQQAAAEASNRAKSEFLSRMSHELRTPLNAVLGFAQIMELDRKTPLPEHQRQHLQQIQQAGWHLLDMIDDVLDLSRIDSGTLKLQSELLPAGTAAQEALAQAAELAHKRRVRLLPLHDEARGWGVFADAPRLQQILGHLLTNAVNYNHPDGEVEVLIRRRLAPAPQPAPDQLEIVVRDNGLGMNEQQLAMLFKPFDRLGREQSGQDGVGIGLVISRHLAQLMGGQLDVSSRENAGSFFTLTLPAAPVLSRAQLTVAEPPAASPPPSPLQPVDRHVLYVEDNETNSDVIRGALASRPWIHLRVASTIEAGLEALHNRLSGPAPDVVLLDVHLPDASGIEFLNLLKANPETTDIPVLMISADGTPEKVDAALQAGACSYLTKPVHLPTLLAQLDQLLGTAGTLS